MSTHEHSGAVIAADTAVNIDPPRTYIDWSGVVAGAFISTASLLLLLHFGVALGLSVASPFDADYSATTMSIAAAVYFALATVYSVAMGAYIAGRMRARSHDSTADEVAFRDGANGLVVWAVGLVMSALLASYSIASVAGAAGSTVASLTSEQRIESLIDAVSRPSPQGEEEGEAGSALANALSSERGLDENERAEAGRMLVGALSQGEFAADDKAYLAALIARRTSLSQGEAERRIDQTFAETREAAEAAADVAVLAAFWSVFTILLSGIAAWAAGAIAGSHRDENLIG